jgi:hypothetical protein
MEEEIGIKAVEFDQDSCGNGKPDRRKDWSGGKKLLHD